MLYKIMYASKWFTMWNKWRENISREQNYDFNGF